MIILKILVAVVVGLVLVLIFINWFRPDLFRFEFVALTNRSSVFHALDAGLTSLQRLENVELLGLPEADYECVQLEGREVVVHTTRTKLSDGTQLIILSAAVKENRGIFARPIGVAARGFKLAGNGERIPLTDNELSNLAAEVDAAPLYA